MTDLHQKMLSLRDKLDSVPAPAPSHRNRTMTAWADAISVVKHELSRALNQATAIETEIARLQSEVIAFVNAIETVRKDNPFLLGAFTPVTAEDWQRLDDLVRREFGHGLDRYSAACMARAWDTCIAAIETLATEAIEAEDDR